MVTRALQSKLWFLCVFIGMCAFGIQATRVSAGMDPVDPPDPPLVTTNAWLDWYNELLQVRLDYVTFARDETRYVSSAHGNDANDGLTPQTAWATVGAARNWVNSSNPTGETREVLFRRGDVWRVSSIITTSQAGVRFADYGDPDDPMPYLTGFTGVIGPNDSQWTADGVTGVYWRHEPTAVSWVREDGDVDLESPLRRMSSASGVATHPGSWWWSQSESRLYIHPRAQDDPRSNGKLYEIAYLTSRGFGVGGDGSLVENLRADGFGLDPFDSSTLREAFQTRVRNDDQAVIRNCVSYYGSSHVIAHFAGSSPIQGGIATFTECVAGFTRPNGSGETVLNTYAGQGECQTIFNDCTVARGTLPSFEYEGRRGDPVFGHTGGAPATLGLTIVKGLRVVDHPNGAKRTGRFNNAPTAGSLREVRVFFVDSIVEGGRGSGDQLCPLFLEGAAFVNCQYTLAPDNLGDDAWLQVTPVNGWWINSTLDLNLAQQSDDTFDLYRASASGNSARCWNSAIRVTNVGPTKTIRFGGGVAQYSAGCEMVNTILSLDDAEGAFEINLPVDDSIVRGNAYWGLDRHSADDRGVILDAPPNVRKRPEVESPLTGGGVPLPGATPLDFDQLRSIRLADPPTIGPLETESLPADINVDGSVDGVDLAMLLAAWNSNSRLADLNGDGAVDGGDLAMLLASWGVVVP